jgi:protein-disulfide isomerase
MADGSAEAHSEQPIFAGRRASYAGKVLDGLVVLVAVIGLISAAVIVRNTSSTEVPGSPHRIRDWQSLALAGHRLGSSQAGVVIIEFADFQCPYCAAGYHTLKQLRRKYPDHVAVVYRHLPLPTIHPQAMAAALASECAAEQGHFEQYHDLLFENQQLLGTRSWQSFAVDAGVPRLDEFQRCLSARRYSERISKDLAAGRSLKLRATPSIIINGLVVEGIPPLADLDDLVEKAMDALPDQE